ncbi:MAG: tRNA-binding protein [Candidatus Shapirobacteria bacterium]
MGKVTPAPIKSVIGYEVLDKVDIRVGTIEKVEDIPESDKLVKLVVDFGDHKRNIIVGMKKERDNPREVEGKQALFVINLESKKMMGHVSEGMCFDTKKETKVNFRYCPIWFKLCRGTYRDQQYPRAQNY